MRTRVFEKLNQKACDHTAHLVSVSVRPMLLENNIFAFFTCDSDTHATWKMPYNSWVKLLFFTYIFAVLLLVNYSENRLNGSILKAIRPRRHL